MLASLLNKLQHRENEAARAWEANKRLHTRLWSTHECIARSFMQSDWYRKGMTTSELYAALGGFLRALGSEFGGEDVLGVLQYVEN